MEKKSDSFGLTSHGQVAYGEAVQGVEEELQHPNDESHSRPADLTESLDFFLSKFVSRKPTGN
jgi:hypothetical protein